MASERGGRQKTEDHAEEDPQNKEALLVEAPEEYTEQQRAAWRRALGGCRAAAVDAPGVTKAVPSTKLVWM